MTGGHSSRTACWSPDDKLGTMTGWVRGVVAPRIVGAVLLGVATLMVPKRDPREHWATPPRTNIVEIVEDNRTPDPFDPINIALRAWRLL